MKLRKFVLAALAASVGLAASLPATATAGTATTAATAGSTKHLEIVNGSTATKGAWPFFTLLLLEDPVDPGAFYAYCGGSLVAPDWVMTAAHCVTGDAPDRPDQVLIGRQAPDDTNGDWRSVDQVLVNPAYDTDANTDDVALLHLTQVSSQPVLPVVTLAQPALSQPGTVATVIGFGDTNGTTSSQPNDLQQAPQTLLSDTVCRSRFGAGFVISSMLCAGTTGLSPCFGDSGGPLMVSDDKGGWIAIGVVSFGDGECSVTSPAVYTRLAAEQAFLRAHIGGGAAPAPGPTPGPTPKATRLAGNDRFATAASISADAFPTGAKTVFVATGENFPDALALGPIAAAKHAPVLLVSRDGVPDATRQELARLQPDEIVAVGGDLAMPAAVVDQLRALAPTVSRVAAASTDRFSTAAALAQLAGPGAPVYLASGRSFADALAGGAAAAATGGVILLTEADSLPAPTAAQLASSAPASVVVLGGTGAVAPAVEAQLASLLPNTAVRRIAGADRYDTAAAISAATFTTTPVPIAYVATGQNFPDALAAVPAAGAGHGPVLLTPPNALPASVSAELGRLQPAKTVVVGGATAIGDGVLAALP